jgi:hypothetical protein
LCAAIPLSFRKHLLEVPAGKLEAAKTRGVRHSRDVRRNGLYGGQAREPRQNLLSPGFSNEVLHMFLALDLTEGPPIWIKTNSSMCSGYRFAT